MLISSIAEYHHKCQTRNMEPDIGTVLSGVTWRNPLVKWYLSAFGLPRHSGSGFWSGLELNGPVFAVQTRTAGGLPRPIANTNHCDRDVYEKDDRWELHSQKKPDRPSKHPKHGNSLLPHGIAEYDCDVL